MNKTDIVAELARRHYNGNKAEAAAALKAVTDLITYATAVDGKAAISGFGVFEKVHREARIVRNPKTGERGPAEAFDFARFRPGTTFQAIVAGERTLE